MIQAKLDQAKLHGKPATCCLCRLPVTQHKCKVAWMDNQAPQKLSLKEPGNSMMTFGLATCTAVLVQKLDGVMLLYHLSDMRSLLKTVDCKDATCIYVKFAKNTHVKNADGIWKQHCSEDVHEFLAHYIPLVNVKMKPYGFWGDYQEFPSQLGVRIQDGNFVIVGM